MPVHVAVVATARAGAAGAKVAAGAARTGATAARAGTRAARGAASATRTAGRAAQGAGNAARGAGRLGQSAMRTGRGVGSAGSRTSGRAHRLQRGARRVSIDDKTLRRVRRQLERGRGDSRRSRPSRPLRGGGRQPEDGQGAEEQASRSTDAGTHARRALRVAGGAAVAVASVRHPLRSLRRLATSGHVTRGGKRRARQAGSRSHARRWLILGLVVFLVFGMISSVPLLIGGDTGSASANAGATLSNADTMEEAFVEAGVPTEYADDFVATANMGIDPRLVAAVAWQESAHFDQDVVDCKRDSSAGAQGIMQFMPDTARERGVDPCRPGEAITAGARYLLEIHGRVNAWDLALAGYNAGPNGVEECSCIPQNGETEDYVPAVNGQWDEYKRTVPEPRFSGGQASGTNPGGPLGSIERVIDSRITATMQGLLDEAVPLFGRGKWIGCYRPGATDGSDGEHPMGRACDFAMSEPLNTHPTPEFLEHGWRLACWMVQNAEALEVRYVIWQELIWEGHDTAPDRRCEANRPADGWSDYNRYDSCNPSAGEECLRLRHYDHVHVSVN